MLRRVLPLVNLLSKKSSCAIRLPPHQYIAAATGLKSYIALRTYSVPAQNGLESHTAILDGIKEPFKATDEILKIAAEEIAALDAKDARQLKIIQMEYDVDQSMGVKVPEEMNDAMWLDLLKFCPSIGSRRRRLLYWFKQEIHRKTDILKKAKKREKHLQRIAETQEKIDRGELEENPNRFLRRIELNAMNPHYYNNVFYSMMNGPHLVFDLGFDDSMARKEIKNLVTQLANCHGINKISKEPYHFHFCNVSPDGNMIKYLKTYLPGFDTIPITVSDDNYLEHYSIDDLVYLTPDSRNVLKEVDPNKVYIIGGLIDLRPVGPLSFAKAKREGIRTAKLPLDVYTRWSQGSKSLPLNQVVSILLCQKETKDWKEAFKKFIPSRKAIQYT